MGGGRTLPRLGQIEVRAVTLNQRGLALIRLT